MKRSGFATVVIILIVGIVLVVAGGIWYYIAHNASSAPTIPASPSVSPTSADQSTSSPGYPYETLDGEKEFVPWWQPYYAATPSSSMIAGVNIIGSIELALGRVDPSDLSNLSRPQEIYQASDTYCGTFPTGAYSCVAFDNRLSILNMDIGNKIDSCDTITSNKLLWEDLWGQAAFAQNFSGKTYITSNTFTAYAISPVEYAKTLRHGPVTSSTAIAIQIMPSIFPILKNYIDQTYPAKKVQYSILAQCLANPNGPGGFGGGIIIK